MRSEEGAVLGTDGRLPVVEVNGLEPGAPGWDRGHLRALRRAQVVLGMLRAARVTGDAAVTTLPMGAPLGMGRTQVQVTTRAGLIWVVRFASNARGTLDGPATIGVPAASAAAPGAFHFASINIDEDDPPHRVREELVDTLGAALAPQVWLDTTTDLGKATKVQLTKADARDATDGWMLSLRTPLGYLLISIGRHGQVTQMYQFTGNQWVCADGAFGRFLRVELAASMGVADLSEVFEPFATRLRQEADRWSGVRAAARHLAARHAA
ncbi:hypothetical protein [Pseudactinotalea terrae]|uniref:hypothetical protein n=1 Tax=Pseudactinotalea terrae TaxID=1743262 RepID=UPI0012E2CF29|nr:hypothetical protein [Pseudactinotalea terrae]